MLGRAVSPALCQPPWSLGWITLSAKKPPSDDTARLIFKRHPAAT